MWIIKILLVISAVVIRAESDDDGYSYDRPEAIPAELAFYLNIPAHHDATSYISKTEEHFNHHQQVNHNEHHGHSHFNEPHHAHHEVVPQNIAENHGLSLNYNQNQFKNLLNHFVTHAPGHKLPFIQENTGLTLVNHPHHQEENIGYNYQFSSHQQQHPFAGHHQQQHSQFQVEPRNINQNAIDLHHEHTPFQYQPNQNSPIPSQELQPPPSSTSLSPSTHHAEPNHRFMASVSSSFNAPLPFPFGVVPIMFDPLPLKTHLLQERLLPISSYEAKVFYKK